MNIESEKQPTEPFIRFEKRPKVQEAIKKIRAIEPKVVFHTQFGAHTTYEEGLSLSEKIAQCDLFIPEAPGWDDMTQRGYRDVSEANIHQAMLPPFKTFFRGELEALYGKNKPIKLIDYPDGHPVNNELANIVNMGLPNNLFKKIATSNDKREEHMVEHLPQALHEFLHENPSLVQERKQNDEPLKVLLYLGACHTRIYHALKEASPQSTRSFDEKSKIFSEQETKGRKILFGKKTE